MNTEILNLRNLRYGENKKGIDVAFPVLAFECEVSVPVEKEVDAYQEAILKLISIGLKQKSVQRSLNITESLCGAILVNLEVHGYIEKKSGEYAITPKASDYLNMFEITNPDTESKYGYILAGAIKKEPLWYFYEGDILNIPRSDSKLIENKLTIGNDEYNTFENADISGWQLEKAFLTYCKILDVREKYKNDASNEEIIELFAGIEADLSEADYQDDDGEPDDNDETAVLKKSKVRKLKREPKKIYLQTRIIIDSSVPGGFWTESPFDFYGNDNELFLRQIQWIMNPLHNVYIGEKKFSEFMSDEIDQLVPNTVNLQADRDIYIRKKLRILYEDRDRYAGIFNDTGMIIDLMRRQEAHPSLLAKENIVSGFNKNLLECLFQKLFLTVPKDEKEKIYKRAYGDFTYLETTEDKTTVLSGTVKNLSRAINANPDILLKKTGRIYSAIKNLRFSNGNSIFEKLLNLIVIHYYKTTPQIRRFFEFEGIDKYIEIVDELNTVRNSAIHSTDRPFTDHDYDYYIDNVFHAAERILRSLKEEE